MNPNEQAGGSQDSRMRRRNIFHRSQLCNDFINRFSKELSPLVLRRALVVAAGVGKLFPSVSAEAAEKGGGASTSCPCRETPIAWHLSSKTIEAYKPLDGDKVVSNVICKIQFP